MASSRGRREGPGPACRELLKGLSAQWTGWVVAAGLPAAPAAGQRGRRLPGLLLAGSCQVRPGGLRAEQAPRLPARCPSGLVPQELRAVGEGLAAHVRAAPPPPWALSAPLKTDAPSGPAPATPLPCDLLGANYVTCKMSLMATCSVSIRMGRGGGGAGQTVLEQSLVRVRHLINVSSLSWGPGGPGRPEAGGQGL